MSPPKRRGRAACHRRPTTEISCREEAGALTLARVIEVPVGPEFEAVVAAQVHLEAACGFPAGIPSQRQTKALRSTPRYRELVRHLPEWSEES